MAQADKQWQTYLAKPLKPLTDRISYLKSKGWEQVDSEADSTPVNTRSSFETDGWHYWKLPPMPPNPLRKFQSVLIYEKDDSLVPPPPEIDEALAYYYFSLATILYKMRDYPSIRNDTYAKQLSDSLWPNIENLCSDKDGERKNINTALDDVEADLAAKTPAKTEQKDKLVKEAGKKTNNKILRPTVDEIAEIIQKLKALGAMKSNYMNITFDELGDESITYTGLSPEKILWYLSGHPVDLLKEEIASLPEEESEMMSRLQQLESVPTREEILVGKRLKKFFSDVRDEEKEEALAKLFKSKLPLLPASELRRLLYEVMPKRFPSGKQSKLIALLPTTITGQLLNRANKYWSSNIDYQIKEIDILLCPYWPYLEKFSWVSQSGIKHAIEYKPFPIALPSIGCSKEPQNDLNCSRAVNDLEKVKHTMEIEAKHQPTEKPAEKEQEISEARHSQDFRSVNWFGTEYSFTPNQAAAVKILWEAWENKTPELSGDFLVAEVESESKRPRDIFKNNSAFGTMIQPGKTKGSFRLVEPDK